MNLYHRTRILLLLCLPALLLPSGFSLTLCICQALNPSCCVPCCPDPEGRDSGSDAAVEDLEGCGDCCLVDWEIPHSDLPADIPTTPVLGSFYTASESATRVPAPGCVLRQPARAPPCVTPFALLSSVRPMRN